MSTLYYTPSRSNEKDLSMMKDLDLLYLEDPTRKTRRMTRELKKRDTMWAGNMFEV